jgi:hypothetical protein
VQAKHIQRAIEVFHLSIYKNLINIGNSECKPNICEGHKSIPLIRLISICMPYLEARLDYIYTWGPSFHPPQCWSPKHKDPYKEKKKKNHKLAMASSKNSIAGAATSIVVMVALTLLTALLMTMADAQPYSAMPLGVVGDLLPRGRVPPSGPSHPPPVVAMPPPCLIPPVGPRKPPSTMAMPPDGVGHLLPRGRVPPSGPSHPPPLVAVPPQWRIPPSGPSKPPSSGPRKPPRRIIPHCGEPTKPPSMEEMINHGKHVLDLNVMEG